MEVATSKNRQVTDDQLREAEKGLIRLLHAKRFPREWIERHVPDVMGQARTDFAVRLAAGREDETVNLLVVIAYRRALKVLRAQRARPQTTSIETIFHLADESTPTPEEEAIDNDRQARIVKALAHLPERDRKLLALVYFEEMSVREAGRRLGWGKSSADRHHQAALGRLRALVGERSLLGVEIAIPAFVAAGHHSPLGAAAMWVEGTAETIHDAAMLAGGRLGPLADTGNAAAMSGAGRTTAGVCGAVVLSCLAAVTTGVVGPGVGAIGSGEKGSEKPAPTRTRAVAAPVETHERAPAPSPRPAPAPSSPPRSDTADLGTNETTRSVSRSRPQPRRAEVAAPLATPEQTASEFGIERGEGQSAPTPAPTSPPPAARPAAPSSKPSSSGSAAAEEFGL